MSEAIEWLKLYMDNNKTGNKVTDKYLEVVNVLIESSIQLQQENTQLKQQLKDKDEKISKVKEYCLIEREDINGSKCDDILETLESNKED